MLFSLWSINITALGTYLFWPEEVGDARVASVIESVPSAALSGGSGWRLQISDASLPATFFITPFVWFWLGWSAGRLSSTAENFSPPPPPPPCPPSPLRLSGVDAAVWSVWVVRGWVKRSELDDFIDLKVHGFGSHLLLSDNWLCRQCIWLMAPMRFLRTSSLSARVLHRSNFQDSMQRLANQHLSWIGLISIAIWAKGDAFYPYNSTIILLLV